MSIKGGKPNKRAIAPNLVVRDAAKALTFYQQVLGAETLYVSRLPSGAVLHAQLRVGETVFLVSEENMGMPEEQFARFEQGMRTRSPHTLNGTSVVLELYVDDLDDTFRRAVDAGARIKMPVSDTFYGDRLGQFEDPFGHVWGVGQVIEELEPEEVDRRARERFAPA
jgi:PhnB protein